MATLNNDSNLTVLVVEDDDGHAQLILDLLEGAGIRNPIRRFGDGQEVMDFLLAPATAPTAEHPHGYVVLLDIRMPRMDGVEVLRRIKADPGLRAIPVVMLTTTDDPREVQGCYELGCNCYVTKPVVFEQFAAALKQLGLFLLIMQVPQAPRP
jgi:CheY-like chemotaxis protein